MGSDEDEMIPCLDFCKDGLELEEGSEGWKAMSKKVREACENHGCFKLAYDDGKVMPSKLSEEMLIGMKTLFDLPEETKQKHISPKPYRSYNGKCPIIPLCQSFGIDDAHLPHIAHGFTNLMWPQGNPAFCETMSSMSCKMLELSSLILKMIVQGMGLPKHYISDVEGLKSSGNLRLIKYTVPRNNQDSKQGLLPHTDKSSLSILCQVNEVQGLEVLSKQGKWIQINIPCGGFVVLVGDVLKAWSNGRLHAVTHRVMMNGDKDRYTIGLFALPEEEKKIEVPHELVDEEHPLRYQRFNYGDYFYYYASAPRDNALEVFAGV
ncbi:hypothetical protein L6164_024270 [Bauhinia variegata]|uniref:Uncharacterized protein n=1 Tax=Bauhinia variegata TaxID=167791 RepID=A0ACB9LWS8_BAUVA|nr:hypothetical protein L6164_024270 [Bauhinia variegata]